MSAPDLSTLRWIKSSYSANNGNCVEIAAIPLDTGWIKSSHSTNNGNCVEIAAIPLDTTWIKSSRSTNNGDCVEIAAITSAIAARDSKNPGGPVLIFAPTAFGSFLQGIRSGAFDRP